MSHDLAGLTRPEGVYIIYSMDAICSDKQIDNMGPLNQARYFRPIAPLPEWIETEGNDQYNYDYLGRESETGNSVYRSAEDASVQIVPDEALDLPNGYGFEFSLDGADYYMKIGPGPYYDEGWLRVTGTLEWQEDQLGTHEAWDVEVTFLEDDDKILARPEGRHRKWVADLTFDQWLDFASNFCIDLLPNGMPIEYNDTLGSLTEYGHIPAIAVDNTEGWGDMSGDPVIDSNFYCSFYGRPWDFSGDRGAMVEDARNAHAGGYDMAAIRKKLNLSYA